PIAPAVCWTAPATPAFPLAPVPVGHCTSLPSPTLLLNSGSAAARKPVKPAVVPDESDRWITVIAVLGSEEPGLSALISASFQVLTLPRYMSAIVLPSSFR